MAFERMEKLLHWITGQNKWVHKLLDNNKWCPDVLLSKIEKGKLLGYDPTLG